MTQFCASYSKKKMSKTWDTLYKHFLNFNHLFKLSILFPAVKAIFQKNEDTGAYEAKPGNNAATLKYR